MEQRIGRYQILEEIAAGGQGTVYRAFDPDSGQIIALKVLHPNLSGDRSYIERFRREASLAASIDHPNVVKIFEVGQDGDQHFIALEFLPESLARVVESGGQMRLEGAAQFGLQIAEGLAAAHSLGIVHRDIKPQNILIGADGSAKVTDFGIARAESLNTMTATGVVMGTPHYMSPEQAKGERADARSDVYSLGCMMYHMLAGEVPFTGETPLAVIRQQIEAQPKRLRERRRDQPRGLEAVIERAMAKDPGRRYQSAGEIAQAIRAAAPGASRSITPQPRRAAPPPAVTPPQSTPGTPSTTWMNAWANAWGKAHRKRWAWVGTLVSVALTLTVLGIRLDAYDRARDWIDSTGLFIISAPVERAAEPAPVLATSADEQDSTSEPSTPSAEERGEKPTSLMPAGRTARVQPVQNVDPITAPVAPFEVLVEHGTLYQCLVEIFGAARAQEMFASGPGPSDDEIDEINGGCAEQLGEAGISTDSPTFVSGLGSVIEPAPAPNLPANIPPELEEQFFALYECMAEAVGTDRALAMFTSGERPVGDEAATISDACPDEIEAVSILEAPGVVQEPASPEPVTQSAEHDQRFAEVLAQYLERESASYVVVASDSSWKVSDLEQAGWNEPGFDDNSWINAGVYWEFWGHENVQSAQPIWYPERHEDDFVWYFFRKSFEVPMVELVSLAELIIQVDDDYVLFLNGVEIGRDESGSTEAPTTYDVLPYLHEGENLIAVGAVDSFGGDEGLTLSVAIGSGGGDVPVALGNANPDIHILAYVDGRSQLLVRGRFAQWFHMDYAAPGRGDGTDFPTMIDGTGWMPEWPDDPDAENRDCFCESSVFEGLEPSLPAAEVDVQLDVLLGRGLVSIIDWPEEANDYTLTLEIDDFFDGGDWYEIVVVVAEPLPVAAELPAVVAEPLPVAVALQPVATTPQISIASGVGLVRGATVSGRVIDAATGLPLRNVAISARDPNGSQVSWDDTDANGEYKLTGLPTAEFELEAYADRFVNQWMTVSISVAGAVLTADFALSRGATISGRVIDAETGLPIGKVEIEAREDSDSHPNVYASTDADGRFSLKGLAAGSYRIEAKAYGQGYIRQFHDDTALWGLARLVTVAETEVIADISFELRPGATITGTVTDASTGLPIANVRLAAGPQDMGHWSWDETRGDGSYTLRGLPHTVVEVEASDDRYVNQTNMVTVQGAEVSHRLDIALDTGSTISGNIFDSETGLPIADADVSAENDSNGPGSWTRTDAAGFYTLEGVAPGAYRIKVRTEDQGYVEQFFDNTLNWNDARLVFVRGTEGVEGIDFGLTLGGTIVGVVRDAETQLPVAGVDLNVRDVDSGNEFAWTSTDADGRYALRGVPPGPMVVEARSDSHVDGRARVDVAGPGQESRLNFALSPGATISGRITDADTGLAIAAVRVKARNVNDNQRAYGYSDADGVYTVKGVAPGSYRIEAFAERRGYILEYYDGETNRNQAKLVSVGELD